MLGLIKAHIKRVEPHLRLFGPYLKQLLLSCVIGNLMFLILDVLVFTPMLLLTLLIPLAFSLDYGGKLALSCVAPPFG